MERERKSRELAHSDGPVSGDASTFQASTLEEFLVSHRADLISRCETRRAQRRQGLAPATELEHGIPAFIDELVSLLARQSLASAWLIPDAVPAVEPPALTRAAARHGRELLLHGFAVDEVVHQYGDFCQAVTELALESGHMMRVQEFHTLNRYLDAAAAAAVAEYCSGHDALIAEQGMLNLNVRLGSLAHELRNQINTAVLALTVIRVGNIGIGGATGAVLDRSLLGLRALIDRSLADVRATAGLLPRRQLIGVAEFIAEVNTSATLEADVRGCRFTVGPVDRSMVVEGDRELLLSALGNLLQNAFKFTALGTHVELSVYRVEDRVHIDVADHCGGLPPGEAEDLFGPFTQGGLDKSGLGLGLSIARRSVEANHGVLSVRDLPGCGCIFTIDLPLHRAAGDTPALT